MTIGTTYVINKIKEIVINADGAGWCQNIVNRPLEMYQLDMFHSYHFITHPINCNRFYQVSE